ncbi:hypothetical protein HK105_201845 [Polyrhizophydium stewartii]|uniref:Receptor ligand binding region domain-containing protein n=1 Tax=Polyrhizophydium stewartii TaxID=2732419 RepID=A0ABR4NFY7_9FUNG
MRAHAILVAVSHATLLATVAVLGVRPANKSFATLTLAVVSDYTLYLGDQSLLGARMAVWEANNSTSVLRDATLQLRRITVASGDTQIAAAYDDAVWLCDTIKPAFVISGMPLSTKRIYPLFYRFKLSMQQRFVGMAAIFRYFGWSKIAALYASSGVYPGAVAVAISYFPSQGINIVSSIKVATYNKAVSDLYYPQIADSFVFLKANGLRIILCLVQSIFTVDMVMAANRTGRIGPDYVWAMYSTMINDASLQSRWGKSKESKVEGAIFISPPTGPFFSDPYFQAWRPRFQSMVSWTLSNDLASYTEISATQTDPTKQNYPSSFFYDDPGTNSSPALATMIGYDSITKLVIAFEQLLEDTGSTAQDLANGLLTSNLTLARLLAPFDGLHSLSGFSRFTANGDPGVSPFVVMQHRGNKLDSDTIATGTVTIPEASCEGTFTPNVSAFFWNGNRSFNDVPIDYPKSAEDFVDLDQPLVQLGLTVAAITCLICLGSAAYLQIYRLAPNTVSTTGCESKSLHLFALVNLLGTKYSRIIERINQSHILGLVVTLVVIVMSPLTVESALMPLQSAAVYDAQTDTTVYTCVIAASRSSALVSITPCAIHLLCIGVLVLSFANRNIMSSINDSIECATTAIFLVLISAIASLITSSSRNTITQFATQIVAAAVGGIIGFILILWPYIWRFFLPRIAKHSSMLKHRHHRSRTRSARVNTETRAMDPIVMGEIMRHKVHMTLAATVLEKRLFGRWRCAIVTIFSAPLSILRIETRDGSQIEYIPLSAILSLMLCFSDKIKLAQVKKRRPVE